MCTFKRLFLKQEILHHTIVAELAGEVMRKLIAWNNTDISLILPILIILILTFAAFGTMQCPYKFCSTVSV